ncbi:WD40 repeat-like protein [Nadsonia fulvescens var. elongata DSM 6958]|uniref:Elongator complex protein 2 n=1 Tax=Nadsonia fulvescens var. elongata DSM 6958 TaxID=857566 RepID=A0A1E3PPR4_9ASCO|nr:WD40 repeat-like protein [Nadsonia fulvescens var. elongata DSM 6958]
MGIRTNFIALGANKQPYGSDYDNSTKVLAFGAGRTIALWKPLDDNFTAVYSTLKGHEKLVNAVKFIPGTDLLISGSSDKTIKVWRKESGNEETPVFKIIQTLTEHSGSIISLAVAQNASVFLSGSQDGSIKFWSCNSALDKPISLIQSYNIGPRFYPLTMGMYVLPDSNDKGYLFAVGGSSASIFIFSGSVETNDTPFSLVTELKGHEDWVRCLAFTIDEHKDVILASAGQDRYIRLWRVHQGGTSLVRKTTNVSDPFLTSPLLTNKEYKFETAAHVKVSITFEALIMGHDDWIFDISWHPQKLQLMSSSADTSLMLWNPDEASGVWVCSARLGEMSIKGASTATGASGGFISAHWLGEKGTSLATVGKTGAWRLWKKDPTSADAEFWVPQVSISGHIREVTDVQWNEDGSYLLTTSLDQTTRLFSQWKDSSSKGNLTWHEFSRPQIHGYDMTCIASVSSSKFVSGAEEKILRVFEQPKGVANLLERLCGIKEDSSLLLPDSAAVPALGLSNKAISASDSAQPDDDDNVAQDTGALAFSIMNELTEPPLEDHLQRHTLWPEVEKLYGHGYEITTASASHDKSVIATTCRANSEGHAVIRLFETSSWQEIKPILAFHSLTVTRARFSHDDKYLLTVSRDRHWAIWERSSVDPNQFELSASQQKGHTRIIWDCSWAPSEFGHVFLTASRDKTVRVWALEEGVWVNKNISKFNEPITAIDAHQVTFDDNLLIAIGLDNGDVYIHSLNKNFELVEIAKISEDQKPDLRVSRISWNPKNKRFAVSSEDTSVRIFELD